MWSIKPPLSSGFDTLRPTATSAWSGRMDANHTIGPMPAVGFGTWPLRGENCAAAVAMAIAAGYRHVDTASLYRNEEDVGEGLRRSGVPRDEVFVTTKVASADIGEGDLQRSAE